MRQLWWQEALRDSQSEKYSMLVSSPHAIKSDVIKALNGTTRIMRFLLSH